MNGGLDSRPPGKRGPKTLQPSIRVVLPATLTVTPALAAQLDRGAELLERLKAAKAGREQAIKEGPDGHAGEQEAGRRRQAAG